MIHVFSLLINGGHKDQLIILEKRFILDALQAFVSCAIHLSLPFTVHGFGGGGLFRRSHENNKC